MAVPFAGTVLLHPQKTKIVYCKDTSRTGQHATVTFDFLGYTFQPRRAKWPGGFYRASYLPAASPSALKAIRSAVREWSLQRRSDKGLSDLARMFNPYIRGWIGYYLCGPAFEGPLRQGSAAKRTLSLTRA